MRGRRASFATTDRTWWSLNTLQEQTIIAFFLTNESDEERHKRGAPPSHNHDVFHSGHLGVAKRPLAD
jgi:hypothetical protein